MLRVFSQYFKLRVAKCRFLILINNQVLFKVAVVAKLEPRDKDSLHERIIIYQQLDFFKIFNFEQTSEWNGAKHVIFIASMV